MTAPKSRPAHLVTSGVSAPCQACGGYPEPVHIVFSATEKPAFFCPLDCPSCGPVTEAA